MSTTEQQEVNVPIEQPAANSAFEEDIISQQAGPEAAAVDQEPTQEQSTSVDYEAESKKFQSMYDRAQAENAKLQQGAQILQLLEQRPDFGTTAIEFCIIPTTATDATTNANAKYSK
jgi:hypothetical protein